MNFRDWFSKLKLQQRLKWRKRKPGTGVNTDEERADPAGSPPRLGPHVTADDGHDNGANTVGGQVYLTDRLPQPDGPGSTPAGEIENKQADVGISKGNPGVRVVVGSGPGRGENNADGETTEQVYTSPHVPIPHREEPEGMVT